VLLQSTWFENISCSVLMHREAGVGHGVHHDPNYKLALGCIRDLNKIMLGFCITWQDRSRGMHGAQLSSSSSSAATRDGTANAPCHIDRRIEELKAQVNPPNPD
jgi:hypothetical protein